jgi:fructose-bisphosphate aldolase class II/tagatose 1,6-diphosphate aldolase GatY/KbaY
MNLKDKLKQLRQENRAILATNFYNYETLRAVVAAAGKKNVPVILQLSESSIRYMGLMTATAMARACLQEAGVEAWLHLDHGKDTDIVKRCIDAGFDSVMIDGSMLDFEENVALTRRVVEMAAEKGVCVEAELGYVAKLGETQRFEYTRPAEALEFVERTGVDALAIAVGNAHGFYKETPHLATDVIREIRKAVPVALVLHGSSGIPHDQLQEAIRNGINKINLATEIKDMFMNSLKGILKETTEIDLRKVFPPAIGNVTSLVEKKLEMVENA